MKKGIDHMIDFSSGHIPDPRDTSFTEGLAKVQRAEALTRIKDLEAEAVAITEAACKRHNDWVACVLRAEVAEAELAALKEQYCDECERESECAVLAAAYEDFNDLGDGGRDFSCNRWKARP
jgi:hypothetical protein